MRSIGSNVATQTVHKPALKRKQRQVIGFACLVNLSSCRAGGAGGSGREGRCTQGVEQIVSFYYCLQPQFFRPSACTDLDKVDDGSRHDTRCMSLHQGMR